MDEKFQKKFGKEQNPLSYMREQAMRLNEFTNLWNMKVHSDEEQMVDSIHWSSSDDEQGRTLLVVTRKTTGN